MGQMKVFLLLLFFSLILQPSLAYDIANARKINNTCALCHGIYGQGTPGSMSPRLAGLPKKYIAKEMAYYRDGTRTYAPMTVSSSIKSMSDKDIDDISEYLASVNLEKMDLPEIPVSKGDHIGGAKIFKKDCKTCHGKEAQGKPKKGAPMIAGQYASYILSQISKFKSKDRHHDDDPEDETFDDYSPKEIISLAAFLTNLTKQKQTERRTSVASKTPKTGMEGMTAMVGMMSMTSDMAGMVGMTGMGETGQGSDETFAGTFKVTSRGEIVLSPGQKDLRMIAGLHGRFKISKTGGLEFHPDSTKE